MSTRTRSDLLALGALALSLVASAPARADDDPMAPYRERFQSGMTHYKAGDYAGAVSWWEPIVTALGEEKGYRVAFDLARAYEKLGDAPHANTEYEAFVRVVQARRARGETIEPVVEKEEEEARAALGPAPSANEPVPPAVSLTPPPPPPPVAASPPPSTPPPAEATSQPAPPAPAAPARTTHPFSPWLLVVGGALTASAAIVCGVEYASALGKKSDFYAGGAQSTQIQSSYDGTRTVAYVSLAATAGLAAITGGLAAWYFAASTKEGGGVVVTAAPSPHGAQVGIATRF